MRKQSGYTYVELVIVTAMLLILASVTAPLVQVASQRQREAELRRSLREMRTAIDRYNDAANQGAIAPTDLDPENQNYPPDLETLVEGVTRNNDATNTPLKFLRRVPIDPMTNSTDWGMRSYQDKPDSRSWGGQNVYDVYSKSDAEALDGTRYRDW